MKCRWYTDFEGVCTNGECPYRGDTCPTSEHPEVCKYAEYAEKQPEIPQLSVEELVKALRLCGSASCTGCALYGFYDCGSIINPQAADMLEKLAAEKDEKKRKKEEKGGRTMKTPDEIKKALKCHRDGRSCHDCPYEQGRTFSADGVTFGCLTDIVSDTLAYIERLEAEREEKSHE